MESFCFGENRKQQVAAGHLPEVLEKTLSAARLSHLTSSLRTLQAVLERDGENPDQDQGSSSKRSPKGAMVHALNNVGVCWLSGLRNPRVLGTFDARIAEVFHASLSSLP